MSERVEIYKPYLGSGQVYLKQAGDAIAPGTRLATSAS